MSEFDIGERRPGMPRSRGTVSGVLLVLLGVWGALAPFVGPYLQFAVTPDQPWVWSDARGWLEVLPGVVAVVGGLILIGSGNRATAMLGGWLAAFAGAWFIVGRPVATTLTIGDPGVPVAVTDAKRVAIELAYFSGLGTVVVFLAAAALGRLSVLEVRTVAVAPQAPVETTPLTAPSRRRTWGGLFGGRHTPAH